MDNIAQQAPLSMEFPRQKYWNGLPFPSPGDLPNPKIKPVSSAWQVDSLILPPGKQKQGKIYIKRKFWKGWEVEEKKSLVVLKNGYVFFFSLFGMFATAGTRGWRVLKWDARATHCRLLGWLWPWESSDPGRLRWTQFFWLHVAGGAPALEFYHDLSCWGFSQPMGNWTWAGPPGNKSKLK